MFNIRWLSRISRFPRLFVIVVALALVGGGATAAASTVRAADDHGLQASAACDPDEPDCDGGGDGGEDDAFGPESPAQYLNDRFTSFQDITQAQVDQAVAQSARLPENGAPWQLVGPSNIGGRVVDLVVDPRQQNTVYIAASGGGVWRSTDTAKTFQPVWPGNVTQTMGALAMGADGALWAGTGEANPSGGGLTYFGNGVYRSTDQGRHWQQWGLGGSGSIGRIAADPTDPNRVFVAATGNLSGTATQRGLYRLSRNGRDWKLVLPTPNATTGAVDIALDPTNHKRLFAVLWDHVRNNGARTYGGVGSGVYRSDDNGDHWTRLDNVVGTAPTDAAGTGLKSDPSLGRIGIAVAPNDPNRVYVITSTQFGPDKGFYVSKDGGNTFTPGGHAGGNSGYSWWFSRIWVDPTNEDHLFAADLNLRESTDGGQTWHSSRGVHADQHAMQFDPTHPGRVYLGDDGGVYHSDSNGATNTWVHATYEPFNQSYHLAVAADDPTRLATGLQDNGSVRTWTAAAGPTDLTQWNAFGGGDGHEVLIDPADHNTFYECFQVANCTKHQDVNGQTVDTDFGDKHSTRSTTDAPLAFDPNNSNVLYLGGNVLDRSTDQGKTFTAISPPGDFLSGPIPVPEEDQGPFYANEYGTITWVAPAKTDSNTIYIGTDTGRLWKTTDLGAHWTEIVGKGLPVRWVNSIVVDPTNANHVFVAFSGYREGDTAANVWESRDGGNSWRNISGRLPNAPVEMLVYDQPTGRLYAATDLGVFSVRPNRGRDSQHWQRVGRNLPNTPVLDIKITADHKTLYAATFGRSVWAIPLGNYRDND